MNTRENESDHEVVNLAGVAASPAIERVAAVLQAVPGLWTSHTHISFSNAGGVEVRMHGSPFEDVSAMALLLGVNPVPYALSRLSEDDTGQVTVVATFWNGADCYDGGIEIKWFEKWPHALEVLGPHMSVLFDEAELTSH